MENVARPQKENEKKSLRPPQRREPTLGSQGGYMLCESRPCYWGQVRQSLIGRMLPPRWSWHTTPSPVISELAGATPGGSALWGQLRHLLSSPNLLMISSPSGLRKTRRRARSCRPGDGTDLTPHQMKPCLRRQGQQCFLHTLRTHQARDAAASDWLDRPASDRLELLSQYALKISSHSLPCLRHWQA